jgi:hypothetical protein
MAAAVAHAVGMANRPLLTAAYSSDTAGRPADRALAGNSQ